MMSENIAWMACLVAIPTLTLTYYQALGRGKWYFAPHSLVLILDGRPYSASEA